MRLPRLIYPGRKTALIAIAAAAIVFVVVGGPAQAKVSGPNGLIAFSRFDPDADDNFTYTMNPDGSNLQPLFPGFTSGLPHWSPDGTEVAVVSGLGIPCPPTCTGNTVIVNPDTGDFRVLASQGFPAVSTFCSLWSPDATHFACEGGNDFDPTVSGVYTIRSSDGGGLTRITTAPPDGTRDLPIDYSPGGQQIVFGRTDINHECSKKSALYVVNVDGTGLAKIPLAIGSRSFAGDFSWSPDGTKISFLLVTQTGPRSFQEGIATANADGSDVQQVTTSPTFDHQSDWGSHALVTP
jgi:Tol biopolymer transport system component